MQTKTKWPRCQVCSMKNLRQLKVIPHLNMKMEIPQTWAMIRMKAGTLAVWLALLAAIQVKIKTLTRTQIFRFKSHQVCLGKSHSTRFVERRKSRVNLERCLTMDSFQLLLKVLIT